MVFRYSRWDGSQDALSLNEDALMDQMSDELLSFGDVTAALRNLLRRGLKTEEVDTRGLQDLMERLRHRRQESLRRYDLSSVMNAVNRHLDHIRQLESQGVEREARRAAGLQQQLEQVRGPGLDAETARKLAGEAQRRAASRKKELDEVLWDHPGRAVDQLRQHEFTDADAKQEFDDLLKEIENQTAGTLLKDLSEGLKALQPGATRGLTKMLRSLNDVLQARMRGDDSRAQQFLDRYGEALGLPESLDDLLQQMQQRLAQTDSLMRSLTASQKQELQSLMNAALGDSELQRQVKQLLSALEALDPMAPLRKEYSFAGKEELDLSGALDVMERLRKMDQVEQQLRRAHQNGSMEGIDPNALEEVLGGEARRDIERLAHMAAVLERTGYVQKVGGQLELTPKGTRKIGQRALQEIFSVIKRDRSGTHTTTMNGQGIEFEESTKTYEFGDPFLPNLQRTIMNAVKRAGPSASPSFSGKEAGGLGRVPVRLAAEDFEVYRTEQLSQASTVLMLDLSLSMAMRGNFMAAKKVALALDNLIRTKFPRDKLFIVGFSTYARQMEPEKLAYLRWDEFEPYTNIQHGLMLSQKLLSRVKGGTKQIIMISDGEPTAHLEGGQVFLQYPPSPQTLRQTLAEVKRCTRNNITINTFMLDRSTYLVDFVEQMTKLNRGRVFYTTTERLGKYILVDYMNNSRKRAVV